MPKKPIHILPWGLQGNSMLETIRNVLIFLSFFFFFISTRPHQQIWKVFFHIWVVFFQGGGVYNTGEGQKDFSRKYLRFSWQEEPTFDAQLS